MVAVLWLADIPVCRHSGWRTGIGFPISQMQPDFPSDEDYDYGRGTLYADALHPTAAKLPRGTPLFHSDVPIRCCDFRITFYIVFLCRHPRILSGRFSIKREG